MRNRTWLLFSVVTLAAFAVRAIHVWLMSDPQVNPLILRPIMDAAMHDLWARGILAGTWPAAEPFFRAPLYPYFLAGLYALFGADQRLAVQLVHVAISAAGAGLAALCAARLFGRLAGWLAGLLFCLAWTSIYFAGELLIVTVAVTLDLLLVWMLLRGDGEERDPSARRWLLLIGLVWGLSAVARPNILILAPVFLWYLHRYRGVAVRSSRWLVLAAGLLLPILPVAAHNFLRGNDTVLIASQGGVNFFIGNNHFSDGRTAWVPGTRPTWQGGYDDVIARAKEESRRDLKPSEVDRFYVRKGLTFWLDEPGTALGLYAHKIRMLFGAGERSNNKNIYFWRSRSPLLRWPVWLGWTPILVLGVVGLCRRDLTSSRRFLLLGAIAAYSFSVLLFFINARFRLPVLALLTIPAGGGLARLVWAAARGSWPDRRRGLVVAAGVLALSLVPDLLTFRENRIDADPFSWHTLGSAYVAAGRLEKGRRAFERAVFINEEYPQRHFRWIEESLYSQLATVLTKLGRPDEAIGVYQDLIRRSPTTVEPRVHLGDLLLQAGRTDAAAAQFEIVLRSDPDNYQAQFGHAWVLLANGDAGAALRRFQALHRRRPNAQALFGVGRCQIELQQYGPAEKTFLEVLQREPNYWQALGNLAGLYDQTGRIDEAWSAYQKLLAINPQDERARQWIKEHSE